VDVVLSFTAPMRRARMEKKISTWLSRRACLRMKTEAPARVLSEPVNNLLARACRQVVAARDHLPAHGDLSPEPAEDADEIEAVSGLRGHPAHLARMHV
jgi:diadenosine tetraphosphatase ApaH/serine/threonine PP2A family protein phosphatase